MDNNWYPFWLLFRETNKGYDPLDNCTSTENDRQKMVVGLQGPRVRPRSNEYGNTVVAQVVTVQKSCLQEDRVIHLMLQTSYSFTPHGQLWPLSSMSSKWMVSSNLHNTGNRLPFWRIAVTGWNVTTKTSIVPGLIAMWLSKPEESSQDNERHVQNR
jgi:hypothetical protein